MREKLKLRVKRCVVGTKFNKQNCCLINTTSGVRWVIKVTTFCSANVHVAREMSFQSEICQKTKNWIWYTHIHAYLQYWWQIRHFNEKITMFTSRSSLHAALNGLNPVGVISIFSTCSYHSIFFPRDSSMSVDGQRASRLRSSFGKSAFKVRNSDLGKYLDGHIW